MMWFQNRRKLARLERHLTKVESQLSALAGALAGLKPADSQPLGELVQSMMSSQSSMFTSTTEFFKAIHQIAAERAAAALGARGGRKRAATARRASNGTFAKGTKVRACKLCRNPFETNFSPADFDYHKQHGDNPMFDDNEPIETVARPPEPERPGPQYPLPVVSFGHEHHTNGVSGAGESGPFDGVPQSEDIVAGQEPNGIGRGN
jgi:hypothetical protein